MLKEMMDLAKEAVSLSEAESKLVVLLFDGASYSKGDLSVGSESNSDLFMHYLEHGMESDLSPGPFFDVSLCRSSLETLGVLDERPILIQWLALKRSHEIAATSFIDYQFYAEKYPSVKKAGFDCLEHYVIHGASEHKTPFKEAEVFYQVNKESEWALIEFIRMFTDYKQLTMFVSETQEKWFGSFFQKEFYEFQVLESLGEFEQVDSTSEDELPILINTPFSDRHDDSKLDFVYRGILEGFRPSCLFNGAYYASTLKELQINNSYNYEDDDSEKMTHLLNQPMRTPIVHWVCHGYETEICPTPLFDLEYYKKSHADLSSWRGWLFEHYFVHGIKEGHRKGTLFFNNAHYLSQTKLGKDDIPIVDFFIRGNAKGLSPALDVNIDQHNNQELKDGSGLEDTSLLLQRESRSIKSSAMQEMIDRAKFIEPGIMFPSGYQFVKFPPVSGANSSLGRVVESVRMLVEHSQIDNIILMPHCRMSGAARVAGEFSQSMAGCFPDESFLIVTTELSNFEKPEWFGDIDTFDLSALIKGRAQPGKVTILLDLVRGLSPKRVININSNLGWHLSHTYGKQVSKWFDFYAYLFTFDIDLNGNKVGYPIRWFLPSANYLSGVIFDSDYLREEIIERLALPKLIQKKMHTLHTPLAIRDVGDYSENFGKRRKANSTIKCFWAGRFDRQKRFDLVVEIANLYPELKIHAWGKKVLLDNSKLDFNSMPDNIRVHGEYEEFEELPIAAFDFFLYTSEWDGLPTILLDIASQAIPVVAGKVGGLQDLLNEGNSWLVDDYLSPESFVTKIHEMLSREDEVYLRSRELSKDVRELCDSEVYLQSIREIF